jgi:hypothetical protein
MTVNKAELKRLIADVEEEARQYRETDESLGRRREFTAQTEKIAEMLRELKHLLSVNAELVKAAQLASDCFKRANANDGPANYLGDDEHEAWTALDNALTRATEYKGEADTE